MVDGTYSPSADSELTRHAHTIKGSAKVMGFDYAGDAAKLLEELLRTIEEGTRPTGRELGSLILDVVECMASAVETGSDAKISELAVSVATLRRHLDGTSPTPPDPGGAAEPLPSALPDESAVQATEPISFDSEDLSAEAVVDLGGLLSSVHEHMVGGSSRVESPKLYQLINRAVEMRLDVDAMTGMRDEVHAALTTAGSPFADKWLGVMDLLDQSLADVQARALELASVRLKELTATFPQLIRFVARRTNKEIRFEISGDDIEIDRQILERLHEPLRHLLVNAVDHGIESPAERQAAGKPPTGTVALRASANNNRLEIIVEDDGSGINWSSVSEEGRLRGALNPEHVNDQAELARLLFLPGFSTLDAVTDVSGDGSGLATVAELAESLKGGLAIDSQPGIGTSISLTLPSSLALQDVLLVEAEQQQWGIPATAVKATFPVGTADIIAGEQRIELSYRGQSIPVASFAAAVGLPETEPVEQVVVVATRMGHFGLTVPKVSGRRQVAVKGISPILGGVPHVTGAALMGAGQVVVILEPNRLVDRVRKLPRPVSGRPQILVVDDSRGVRQLVAAALSSHGFAVVVAGDAASAMKRLDSGHFDALVVDYMMPGSDGVDLVGSVRESYPVMPIVMVSGVARQEDQDRAWAAGVNAYLNKFDLRQGVLAHTLRSLLNIENDAPNISQGLGA